MSEGTRAEGGDHESSLIRQRVLDAPTDEVFAWHERPGAAERLLPPWEPVRVEQAPDSLHPGSRTVLRASVPGPVAPRLVAEQTGYQPPREFTDTQVSGPFSSWKHRHVFEPVDGERTRMTDEVTYELPLYRLGGSAVRAWVQSRLYRIFGYRHRQLADDLAAHRRARERGTGTLRVAVTGSTGLIGSALVALLRSGGHRVTRLVRREPTEGDEIFWDPGAGQIDADGLRGLDAVVNLAGAPMIGRWTDEHKRRIRDSRVRGTHLLAETLAGMDGGPGVLISGSGINFYGRNRGQERLTEEAEPGTGFLADVVSGWEAAAEPARQAGLRVVHVRTGLVQSPAGGILRLQLPVFQAGLGGRLGPGSQWMSWIGIDDIVGIFHHALTSELHGVVNGTAPHPVTNAEFTRTLGHVLRRPTPFPVPRKAPSLALGEEAADETAFASLQVLPARAEESGYVFRHPDLEGALRHVLGRSR